MSERALRVAVVGGFSSGKSALINAIIGQAIAPMGVTPVTAVAHRFAWAPEVGTTFFYQDGSSVERSLADLAALTGDAAERARVRDVRIGLPVEALKDIEIWDTPGFGSNTLAHELAARKALADAEVAIWVTPIDQALSRSEAEKLRRLVAADTPVLLVVNKADLADDAAERDELLSDIRKEAGPLVRDVVWASARAALAGGGASRVQSNLPQVETALATLLGERRAKMRSLVRTFPVGPNDVVCPDCQVVGRFDDDYCVCGRGLADQHRQCPRCREDNTVLRPRCRKCNLVFEAWVRGEGYAARAEEIRLGLLVDAEASLTVAVESVEGQETWAARLHAVTEARTHAGALTRASLRAKDAEKAIAEWERAIALLTHLGVANGARMVGVSGLRWAADIADAEEAEKALLWWAEQGVRDAGLWQLRRAQAEESRHQRASAMLQAEVAQQAAADKLDEPWADPPRVLLDPRRPQLRRELAALETAGRQQSEQEGDQGSTLIAWSGQGSSPPLLKAEREQVVKEITSESAVLETARRQQSELERKAAARRRAEIKHAEQVKAMKAERARLAADRAEMARGDSARADMARSTFERIIVLYGNLGYAPPKYPQNEDYEAFRRALEGANATALGAIKSIPAPSHWLSNIIFSSGISLMLVAFGILFVICSYPNFLVVFDPQTTVGLVVASFLVISGTLCSLLIAIDHMNLKVLSYLWEIERLTAQYRDASAEHG